MAYRPLHAAYTQAGNSSYFTANNGSQLATTHAALPILHVAHPAIAAPSYCMKQNAGLVPSSPAVLNTKAVAWPGSMAAVLPLVFRMSGEQNCSAEAGRKALLQAF